MSKEKQIEEMIEIVKPFVSGLACGDESGSCELTDCKSCKARSLVNKLLEADCGKQSEWISVEERLPDREGTYLVYTYKGVIKFGDFRCYYAKNDKPQFNCDVTHWMPLPFAPKGGE